MSASPFTEEETLITEFNILTDADRNEARHWLEASNWDLNAAVNAFYAASAQDSDQDGDDEEMPSPVPRDSGTASPAAGNPAATSRASQRSNLVSFSDIRSTPMPTEPESDDDGPQQDFFAGGEKSGLAIKNPKDNKDAGKDIIKNILTQARDGAMRRREEATAGPSRPRFSGSGHTLGSEDTPSVTIPDLTASRAPEPVTVTRSLTFWRNGFSIEDGPLMRYDDPANQEILRAIESGRAPTALMGIQQGQHADVHVYKRLDEDYVAPKKKPMPFSGQGNRLGSATVGEHPATPPPAPAPSVSSSIASRAAPAPLVEVDATQPTTSLQIRLGDGTRLVSRFNHTHTVGDVYSFVNSSSTSSRTRDYVLQTTFPNKELTDHKQTLKDAGLINAVVVQKWC